MKKTLLPLLIGVTVANAAAQVPLTNVQFDAQTSKVPISTLKNQCMLEVCHNPQLLQSANAKRLPQSFHQVAKARLNKEAKGKLLLPPQPQRTTIYSSPKNTSGVLNEGFESWDGQTPDWLPEG